MKALDWQNFFAARRAWHGKVVFSVIYAKAAERVLASGEQALCDFAWLNLRDGIEPQSLITVRNLASLNHRRLKQILRRYPGKVQDTVGKITGVASS